MITNKRISTFLTGSKGPTILWVGLVAGLMAVMGGLILAFGGLLAATGVMIAVLAAIIVLRDIESGFWAVVGVVCLLPFATIPIDVGITPTLLDLAGIDIPSGIQGRSILPMLKGASPGNWRNSIYYHYYELSFGLTKHYGLRTDRYKIIHFYDPVDAWELYDLENDPGEMNNLINEPDYAPVLLNMKQRLAAKQKEVEDTDRTTY